MVIHTVKMEFFMKSLIAFALGVPISLIILYNLFF